MALDKQEKEFLLIEEVAEFLRVSRQTIYEYMDNKENPLPVVYFSDRTPRIRRNELERWIEKQSEIQKSKSPISTSPESEPIAGSEKGVSE